VRPKASRPRIKMGDAEVGTVGPALSVQWPCFVAYPSTFGAYRLDLGGISPSLARDPLISGSPPLFPQRTDPYGPWLMPDSSTGDIAFNLWLDF
jgi:hypothetical protein